MTNIKNGGAYIQWNMRFILLNTSTEWLSGKRYNVTVPDRSDSLSTTQTEWLGRARGTEQTL